MASPQCEDGFTKIANEIVDKLAQINLSKYEWRVLWAVFRKTYGWKKILDFISITQLEEITGLDRRNVSRTKRSLLNKNMLISKGNKLGFNKDYDSWNVSVQTTDDIVYRDTRPKWFPPPGYPYKKSSDGLCEHCFKVFDWHLNQLQSHHILPKSKGGKDCFENKVLLCLDCHHGLHEQINEWFRVFPDDRQGCYRHFVSLLSSLQTTFLVSLQTTTKETLKDNYTKESKLVIAHLNKIKGGREYTYTLRNLSYPTARLKEGHTVEDLKAVVDVKWKDPDFNKKYFRPSTLFNSDKFEGYLMEATKEGGQEQGQQSSPKYPLYGSPEWKERYPEDD